MSDLSPSPARYQALIQLLRTAEDLWNASRVFFARWDLSPSQFNVLNLLFSEPNGLSQSELSRLLIMHRSNATGLVDRLEKRGLLRRQDAPEDRRAYRVVLTPQGQDLLNAIYPHYYQAANDVWADLPETRASDLLIELQELARNAARVAGTARDATEVSGLVGDAPTGAEPEPEPSSSNADPIAEPGASGAGLGLLSTARSRKNRQSQKRSVHRLNSEPPPAPPAADRFDSSVGEPQALRTSDL